MSGTSDAQMVIDDTFAEWGHAATYAPPGGQPGDPITILVDLRDEGARPDDGRPLAGQISLQVRKSEVAAPATRGVFAFDNRTVTIVNRPKLDDEEGLVWTMWAE